MTINEVLAIRHTNAKGRVRLLCPVCAGLTERRRPLDRYEKLGAADLLEDHGYDPIYCDLCKEPIDS